MLNSSRWLRRSWAQIRVRGLRTLWEVPAELIVLRLARRTRDGEVPVVYWQAPPESCDRVWEALDAIKAVSPLSYDELARHARRILVTPAPGASFWWLTSTVVVPVDMALGGNAVRVALALIHEGCHALIAATGELYTPESASDIERRCIMAQIAFLDRLEEAGFANTRAWRQHYEKQIASYQYSETALYSAKTAFLAKEGVPRWVRALHRVMFAPARKENGPEA